MIEMEMKDNTFFITWEICCNYFNVILISFVVFVRIEFVL